MSRYSRTCTRRAGWLAGAAVATSLVAACGTAGPTQPASPPTPGAGESSAVTQPPATSPSSPPAPASPAPAASASTSRGPSSPSPANSSGPGLTACRTASLRIAIDDSQAAGAAGSAYYPLNFTNTSAAPCGLYGYPGVSFVAAPAGTGAQIGAAALRSGAFAKVAVRLAAGGTAHAWLQVTVAGNYPSSTCRPVTARWLRVYPPGETVAGYVGHAFSACSATSTALLTVLPVRTGAARAGITP
jgi:Protein of unknown function (DUF4232)